MGPQDERYTQYEIILPASRIPSGSSVRKLTGEKIYTLLDAFTFKAYGPDNSVIAQCALNLSDGCRVLVDGENSSRVNVVNGDKKLVVIMAGDEVLDMVNAEGDDCK